MSKMVSRWESTFKAQQAEIKGYMDSKGSIKYSFFRGNRNLGDCTAEKNELLEKFKMVPVFNREEDAKLEFEVFGCLL